MKAKLAQSQISNLKTCNMYRRQMLMLAENVFNFKYMPKYVDIAYVNKCLLRNGSIAFFVDEILGLLALPYIVNGSLDVYNRPRSITAIASNGYEKVLDKPSDFVIMYDNNGRYPLFLDVVQYAERIALETRTRRY